MTATVQQVSDDELAAAREQGQHDAQTFVDKHAPTNPLLRCAWAAGVGREDVRRDAVLAARAQGVTWRQIAEAMSENPATIKTRYTQQDRHKRYAERQRAKEQDET